MKKTILIAIAMALVTLMPSVAGAASPAIPEQFRGDWCTDEEEGDFLSPILHRCKTYSNTNFRIQAHTYGAINSNWDCTFTSINYNSGLNNRFARRSGQNCLLHMPSPPSIYTGWATEDLHANPITSNF